MRLRLRLSLSLLTAAVAATAVVPAARAQGSDLQDQIRDLSVSYVENFDLYQQSGLGDLQDDAFTDAAMIGKLMMQLAADHPDQYEAVLERINKLGRRNAAAVFDLGLSIQSAWDAIYLYDFAHQLIVKDLRRDVPQSFFSDLTSFNSAFSAMTDPFENVSYFKAFASIRGWWGVGALAGEGVAQIGQKTFPVPPGSILNLATPYEGDAIAAEGRISQRNKIVSIGVAGTAGAAVTRLGASRLAGIRAPAPVKVIAWIGLLIAGYYADKEADAATSDLLSSAHERQLLKKLKGELRELATAVKSGKDRRSQMMLARNTTAVAYRLAAHWEQKRTTWGLSEKIEPDVQRYLDGEQDQVCREFSEEIARGELKQTVEGIFLQLDCYFQNANLPFLDLYAKQVFYARAMRNVVVKKLLQEKADPVSTAQQIKNAGDGQ